VRYFADNGAAEVERWRGWRGNRFWRLEGGFGYLELNIIAVSSLAFVGV